MRVTMPHFELIFLMRLNSKATIALSYMLASGHVHHFTSLAEPVPFCPNNTSDQIKCQVKLKGHDVVLVATRRRKGEKEDRRNGN
jgi:hypothetical protein